MKPSERIAQITDELMDKENKDITQFDYEDFAQFTQMAIIMYLDEQAKGNQ